MRLLLLAARGLAGRRVDEVCQQDVTFRKTLHVVGAEGDADAVVDVEPLRVVIHLVCLEGDSSHETKGLVEVGEDKVLLHGVAALHLAPSCEASDWGGGRGG